jgi:hypothetical protein
MTPPDDLPTDVERFYRGDPSTALHDDTPTEHPSALDRLGSSPLPKTGFPFIGFLSGVYEHVSSIARGEPPTES